MIEFELNTSVVHAYNNQLNNAVNSQQRTEFTSFFFFIYPFKKLGIPFEGNAIHNFQ